MFGQFQNIWHTINLYNTITFFSNNEYDGIVERLLVNDASLPCQSYHLPQLKMLVFKAMYNVDSL